MPVFQIFIRELKSIRRNVKLNINTKFNVNPETSTSPGIAAESRVERISAALETGSMEDKRVPLSNLPPGTEGIICSLAYKDKKFAAMGLLPGVQIKLISCSPSYVLKAEETLFALDRQMAQAILVDCRKAS